MKKKMSVTTVACNRTHGQTEGLSNCFQFAGKPNINADLEDLHNSFGYSELLCTPETVEPIARETNQQPKFRRTNSTCHTLHLSPAAFSFQMKYKLS
jgi:hypothetical protein